MKRIFACTIIAILAVSAFPGDSFSEPKGGREKLGLRLGYVDSASDIKNAFGNGSAVTLHFTERIKPPFFIGLSLGALYLGEASNKEVTRQIFGSNLDANMRIIHISIGPTFEIPIGQRHTFYFSGSIGLYSISVLLEQGFFGSDISDEHFGASAGAGLYWPLTDNWKLDFNFAAHHVRTSEEGSDIFFLYSKGDSNPNFYQFSLGVAISLN